MKVRAWFGGAAPPEPEVLLKAEAADAYAVCLYAVTDGAEEGEWVPVIQSIRAKMEGVRDDPGSLRAYSGERSQSVFAAALFDLAGSRRDRAGALQQLGAFTFESSDEEMKTRATRALADREGGGGPEGWAGLARELSLIWRPQGLLQSVLHEPAAVAATLVQRLDVGHAAPLAITGHAFAGVARGLLEPLALAKTVPYQRDSEIHLVTPVREALESWDADPHLEVGPEDFSLLEVLAIHEILEVILDESTQLDPLASHLVAVTFGRCLRDAMLAIAVEAFCLDWLEAVPESSSPGAAASGGPGSGPDLSDEEVAEAERNAAARTSDEQGELLEDMFEEEPADQPAVERASGSPVPADQRPTAPEPTIRSTVSGTGEDLASMFDDEEESAPSATADQAPAGGARGTEPVAAADVAADADARRKRSYQLTPLDGDGPRVLVVDDSAMTRHLVCEVARKLGYQTVEAVDGIQAVALARFHKPDLIVLDIAMPGGNGLTALSDLRAHPECASTPIIMLTVESGRASIQSAIEQGATDYLIKPVNVKELSKRMAQHLGAR